MTTFVTCDPAVADDRYAVIKTRQQQTWASGNFSVIGTTLQLVGELLCEAVDIRAGEAVLDVAAGNGNATLAAARRGAQVTSTDYVEALLEDGRRRAEAEGAQVTFQWADAEALPFADASFDVVLSTYGVMFTPDQKRAAGQMLRVVRPGGRIGVASWTPGGFIGDLFRTVGAYIPPVPNVASPLLWGSESHVEALFEGASGVRHTIHHFLFRYRSAQEFVDVFRAYYGPVHRAFAALEPEKQQALEADLLALLKRWDRGGAAGLVVPGEYLESVITR
ncbi:MAG TPA: class I SAM-dependent methyltransferase [Vicinamibacterales bacterium]